MPSCSENQPGNAGVAPRLERHGVDVDQPPGGKGGRKADECEPEPAPPRPFEHDEPAEDVGREREEVVAKRVELSARRRLAVEPRLREQPVGDDDCSVREGQPVGPEQPRHGSRGGEREHNRKREQDVLPGGDRVERRVADPRLPEERHREVVEREPDGKDEQRSTWPDAGHVVATSVRPRLSIRTATGNSDRSSPAERR